MDRLPEEQLEILLPALNDIIHFINNDSLIDNKVINQVLKRIKCDPEDWAVEEIKLWANILIKACILKDSLKINDIFKELVNRGIPEFSVVMALEKLTKKTDLPNINSPLAINQLEEKVEVKPNIIDFGLLQPGEGGVITVIVKSSTVSLVKKPNSLRVMLINQGDNSTSLKVELLEGKTGEILDDHLVINTDSGSISIPVRAKWSLTKNSEPALLSWCPICKKTILKKSLFYNKYAKQFECFSCKRIFAYNDQRVAESNNK